MNKYPKKQGLYNPLFEHDSCGVGFVVNINVDLGLPWFSDHSDKHQSDSVLYDKRQSDSA